MGSAQLQSELKRDNVGGRYQAVIGRYQVAIGMYQGGKRSSKIKQDVDSNG